MIKLTEYAHGSGCGCKVSAAILKQIVSPSNADLFSKLIVGNNTNDDAAVYEINKDQYLISTADFFTPLVNDAFDFGCIAAANALSDVYAMGGKPVLALAIMGWPVEKIEVSYARKIMDGAISVCDQAGIPIAGGHTIESQEPFFGLSVNGLIEKKFLKKNNTVQKNDVLLLTRPLGSGIISTAIKRNVFNEDDYPYFIEQVKKLNNAGYDLARIPGIQAMTDITGFGFLGHLLEMIGSNNLSAEINFSALPLLKIVHPYIEKHILPDAAFRNWNHYSKDVLMQKGVNTALAFSILSDPQTNGGLLVAARENALPEIENVFLKYGIEKRIVGKIVEAKDKKVIVF